MGSERPSAGRYGCANALPPPRSVGLVHAAWSPLPAGTPKRLFCGGGAVERNDEYVMMQPLSLGEWQSGMFCRSPPTSPPTGTWKLVPSRIAETISSEKISTARPSSAMKFGSR